ncbi:hypothetical protein SPI_06590 [Niveomyces insectorum RCEF 264]|uniref:Uncharacterized protein n=1 Tax=Niveomyces insectorum RCEF 264 TaxID=1081102 RepID=A0A167REI6_9HYPO|nr:hypothetical protein SPI_06590 [Niveomyces insectorum RCEF 264]
MSEAYGSSSHAGSAKTSGKSKTGKSSGSRFPPLNFEEPGYDVTQSGTHIIPQEFRNMIVWRVYVEFLKLPLDSSSITVQNAAKNHVTIKVDFTSVYDGKYKGVRINMQPNYEIGSSGPEGGPTYKPGQLLVKPVIYWEKSLSAARAVEIQFAEGKSLDWLLFVLCSNKLHGFHFVDLQNKYYGCRDFVTQAVYQFYLAKYTTGEIIDTKPVSPGLAQGVDHVFAALGYRYLAHPLGFPQVCLIDKGYFPEYERVESSFMPYH